MAKDTSNQEHKLTLRQAAEAKLSKLSGDLPDISNKEIAELVHELQTHQIELEMQNDELRDTQDLLIEARDRYSNLFDFAPVGYITCSADGLILESNLTFASIVGVDRKTLLNKAFSAFVFAEDQDNYYKHRKRVLGSKQRDICQIRIGNEGRDQRWLEIESILSDEKIDAPILRSTIRDITEGKEAEAALRDSEKKYGRLYNSIRDAILVANSDRRIIDCNQAFSDLFEYSFDEIKNKETMTLYENKEQFNELGQALKNHRGNAKPFLYTVNYKKKSGAVFAGETSIYYLIDVGGDVSGFIGLIRDVTERKQGEQALRESQNFLETIVENIPDMIFVKDANKLNFLQFNKAGEELLGHSREELIGKSDYDFFLKEEADLFTEKDRDVLRRGKLQDVPIESIHTKDKGERILHTKKIPIMGEDGMPLYLLGISEDITERKQAEEEIAAALLIAEQANQVKDQFIANISHEIRTPLNSIIGFSDLFFQRYADMVEPKDKEIFGYIAKASERLMKTVDSILNISVLKAGAVPLHPRELNLNALVNSIVGQLNPRAVEKKLILRTSFPTETNLIFVDEYCIQQAIYNLTDNAIKFTYDGHVELKIGHSKDQVTLSVKDTGIGISEAYQKQIFTPYTQESEGFTKHFQGVGLGLALAKIYLDLNHVSLELETKSGQGSTFTLTFPKPQGA
ncbi:MAG: PAS domain-containing sensor histidine kinase [Candidatus Marinimicrobia bacterium]|nr:PAS domain-containing sensor histidine kinase [Candidatus Neomarinimicrobiota bacterium]